MTSAEETVIVVLDVEGLSDRAAMEKHLKREGLRPVEGEPLAYLGHTPPPIRFGRCSTYRTE